MVRVIGDRAMNHVVKDLAPVRAAVHAKATEIGQKAQARLAAHHTGHGESQVVVRMGDVDAYVILEDPAALSIEFGHWYRNGYGRPKYVPGLYIITGAAGLI